MRYREYKGYLIVKDFVADSYLIKKDGKTLYYGISQRSFGKLKKAKAFVDMLENGEIEISDDRHHWTKER